MADAICSAVTQVLANNPVLLYGPVAKTVSQRNPWLGVLKGGVLPANVATTLSSVAQLLPNMGVNLGAPTPTAFSSIVGSCSAVTMTTGANSYTFTPYLDQFLSSYITLSGGFDAIETSLYSTVDSYATGIADYIAADIQNQMFINSGVKVVSLASSSLATMTTGTFGSYATAIPTTAATGNLDWNLVNAVARNQREVNRVEPFDDGQLRLIVGYEALESLRTQLGGASALTTPNVIPLGSLANGGMKLAQDALVQYAMEITLRGINFMLNPRPMRFNIVGGVYTAVAPTRAVSGTYGAGAEPNPGWNNAAYEAAFLVGKESFLRLAPAAYTGEDKVRFGKQFFMGDIKFLMDNIPGNQFYNIGQLGAQIGRAYQPVHPWHIATIIFKRCLDPQLTGCTGISALG
jgi:hypothetical protein